MQSDQEIIPPLREDLELIPDKINQFGDQTYIIRDIRANRYVRIGADTFRIMALWQPNITFDKFQIFLLKNSIDISKDELRRCIHKISTANLLQHRPEFYTQKIRDANSKKYKNLIDKAIHSYLFIKIPLLYPDKFIKKTLFLSDVFFSRYFLLLSSCAALIAIFFLIPQLDRFKSSIFVVGNLEMAMKFLIALSFSKIIHEFSHAYAAARKNCHVGSVGIGFIVGAPVFYADVTDTWRLNQKSDRILVAASGVIAEVILAIYATIIWLMNFNSFVNDVAAYLATTTWLTTIFFNANPLMRFDGYYIISDLFEIKNLQQKSFFIVGQKFREIIFGFQKSNNVEQRHLLIIYGISAIIYRVIVITGIALLLYHFVFRLLGFILFLIEIWVFLAKPLMGMFYDIWKNHKQVGIFRAALGGLGLILSIIFVLFAPFDTSINVPGVFTREQVVRVFQKYDSQVTRNLKDIPFILHKDDPILFTNNPSLDVEFRSVAAELLIYKSKYERLSIAPLEKDLAFTLAAEVERIKSRRQQIMEQIKSFKIISSLDGYFIPQTGMHEGEVIASKTLVGTLTSGDSRIIAFVPEKYLFRLAVGMDCYFFNAFDMELHSGRIVEIEKYAVEKIKLPHLASVYGGPIKTHGSIEKGLYSEEALYRVIISAANNSVPVVLQMGYVSIKVKRSSLAKEFLDAAERTLLREAHLD